MSAAEIIEMVKKLPPEQRAEIRSFLNKDVESSVAAPVRYIATEEFEAIAPKIFKDNHELLRRLAQ